MPEHPFDPDWTIHPGPMIREAIQTRGLTQATVAKAIGISQKHLSEIVNAKAGYSARWAVAFAQLVDVTPEFIWNLLKNYQLDLALGRKDVTHFRPRYVMGADANA